jgi:uncharacterized protein
MTGKGPRPAEGMGKISVPEAADQPSGNIVLPSCGDFDIRIAADGTWFYRGSPIGRKALVKLFATVLERDADGEYWMVTPVERGRVIVDDAPFTAVEMSTRGQGMAQIVSFRTNVDQWIEAGPEHPIRVTQAPGSGEPRPYILVRDRLEALILRPVFYHFVDATVEERHHGRNAVGVWSNGIFFPLGSAD